MKITPVSQKGYISPATKGEPLVVVQRGGRQYAMPASEARKHGGPPNDDKDLVTKIVSKVKEWLGIPNLPQ